MNPAHRIMAALGAPYGWERKDPARGIAKRRKLRKVARASRRYNLRAR